MFLHLIVSRKILMYFIVIGIAFDEEQKKMN